MKVYVYPADQTGCGYYRAIWPAKALKDQGYDVQVVMADEENDLRAEVKGNAITAVYFPDDADVMVLQRPMHFWLARAIPIIREAGVAVVVDIDDDLESIHPRHPAYAKLHPKFNKVYNWDVTRYACRNATAVTVSTAPLRRLYSPMTGECYTIKNKIPSAFLSITDHQDGNVAIGWMGSVHSHPDDLQVMGQTPARLQREGFPWKFVGPDRGIQQALHFDVEPHATGYAPIEKIPTLMAETIGIGVAPLQDTRFNRAKSYLKQLEYAALGIPSVCSDLPEYRELARETGALLARRPKDWYQHLKRLSLDDDLRVSISQRARNAASRHTVEEHAGDWMQVWLNAWRVEQRRRKVSV